MIASRIAVTDTETESKPKYTLNIGDRVIIQIIERARDRRYIAEVIELDRLKLAIDECPPHLQETDFIIDEELTERFQQGGETGETVVRERYEMKKPLLTGLRSFVGEFTDGKMHEIVPDDAPEAKPASEQ